MAVDVFDLKASGPGSWTSHRRAVSSDGALGPRAARQIDAREIREFVVRLAPARNVDLWRARKLWEVTARGVLPLDYTEAVHGLGIGDIEVVLVDDDLERVYQNPEIGILEVRLREWRG